MEFGSLPSAESAASGITGFPPENKKAPRRFPKLRKPDAGLVSLTMTCLSYLLVMSSKRNRLPISLALSRRRRVSYLFTRLSRPMLF